LNFIAFYKMSQLFLIWGCKYTQHANLGVLLLLVLLITDEDVVSVGLSGLRSSGPLVINLIEEKENEHF